FTFMLAANIPMQLQKPEVMEINVR
ncbi:hypothetical protein EVA_18818, partial [gut metagenome]